MSYKNNQILLLWYNSLEKEVKKVKILVFDTCLDKMYVTLSEDNKILTSKIIENHDNKYHSAFLISTIKEVLKSNNLTPSDLEVIGTNIGPGSFTGIRACTTVARVMGQQLNIPVIGVSSLEILSHIAPVDKSAVVALDARKSSAYFYIDNKIKGAILLEEIEKNIPDKTKYYLITDNKLKEKLGGISYQDKEYKLGDILAAICYNKLKSGNVFNWYDLKPLYIQPPPAC